MVSRRRIRKNKTNTRRRRREGTWTRRRRRRMRMRIMRKINYDMEDENHLNDLWMLTRINKTNVIINGEGTMDNDHDE